MESTKYQKFFNDMQERQLLKVPGSTLVVELITDEELKSKGGIIIATQASQVRGGVEENRLSVGRVLMAGEGYFNQDTNEIEPLDIKVGAIVILPKFSLSVVSVFPGITAPTNDKLGLVKESQILAYYPTEEAYNEAKELGLL